MKKVSNKKALKNKDLRVLILISLSSNLVLNTNLIANASTLPVIQGQSKETVSSQYSKVLDNNVHNNDTYGSKNVVLPGGISTLVDKEEDRNTLIQDEKLKKKEFIDDFLSGKSVESLMELKSSLESIRYSLTKMKDLGSHVDLSVETTLPSLFSSTNETSTGTSKKGSKEETTKDSDSRLGLTSTNEDTYSSTPSIESLYSSKTDISYKQNEKDITLDTSSDLESPVKGRFEISSLYGVRDHPVDGVEKMHYGLDLRGAEGTDVLVAWSGTVSNVYSSAAGGNTIEVKHKDGLKTRYLHLSAISVYVGQVVSQYDVIGKVGATGKVTGPHLHFEVNVDGSTVDPIYYFGNRGVLALNDYMKRSPEEKTHIEELIASVSVRTDTIQQVLYGVSSGSSEPGVYVPRTYTPYVRSGKVVEGDINLKIAEGYTPPTPVDTMSDYFSK